MTMRERRQCGRKRKIENRKKIKCSGLRHTHHTTMQADGDDCTQLLCNDVLLLHLRFIVAPTE